MYYRALNSIPDAEISEFRLRLAEYLKAQIAADGTRVMSEADVEIEAYRNCHQRGTFPAM